MDWCVVEADIQQVYDGNDGTVFIATASSTVRHSGGFVVRLWHWKPSRKTGPGEMNNSDWKLGDLLELIWKMLMVLFTCIYFVDFISRKITLFPKESMPMLIPEPTATATSWFYATWLAKEDTGLESRNENEHEVTNNIENDMNKDLRRANIKKISRGTEQLWQKSTEDIAVPPRLSQYNCRIEYRKRIDRPFFAVMRLGRDPYSEHIIV